MIGIYRKVKKNLGHDTALTKCSYQKNTYIFLLIFFFISDFSSGWAFKSGRYRYPEPNDRDTDYRYTVTSLMNREQENETEPFHDKVNLMT